MAIEIVPNCKCDACVAVDPNGRQHIFSDGHLVDTGPIRGPIMLADGTVVDVTPQFVEVESAEKAAEIAHAIGQHWAKHGHPDDFDIDEMTQERIQRRFVYDDTHHRKHGRRGGRKQG